jgi:hypothetical protein
MHDKPSEVAMLLHAPVQAQPGDYLSKVAFLSGIKLQQFMLDNMAIVKDLDAQLQGTQLLLCNPAQGTKMQGPQSLLLSQHLMSVHATYLCRPVARPSTGCVHVCAAANFIAGTTFGCQLLDHIPCQVGCLMN